MARNVWWIVAASLLAGAPGRADPVVVFAAASLETALDAVAAKWREAGGGAVALSYGASSAMARQIEQGAPADVFFSADVDWMAYLGELGFVDEASRRDLLGNRLVLIAARPGAEPVTIGPDLDLAGMIGDGRLAVAEVEAVPAGRYAQAALRELGLWATVEARLVEAENVRAALRFVARGEAPLGIVYATDAAAEPGVNVLGTFPAESHPPIVYPVALTAAGGAQAASDFLDFLDSDAARTAFEAQGFTVLD
jgi:molybdate transport system substrate-binding protein